MSESMNDKIAKLLRKAERTDNPHEAESYSKMAERLMLKWGIEEAIIRSRMGDDAKPESIVTKSMPFPKLYVKARMNLGSCIIRGMGNMRVYIRNNMDGTKTLMILGFESDVDRAMVLISSLLLQADHAQDKWWKSYPLRKGMSQADGFKARRQFLYSFGFAVEQRLKEMRVEAVQEQATKTKGTELALLDRDAQVAAEFDKLKLKKSRAVKGSMHGGDAGRAAGRSANLGGKSVGGSRRSIDR